MLPFFQVKSNQKRFREILESWESTPYLHLTCVKGRGADCALFIGDALQELGILATLHYDYYPQDWFYHTKDEVILDGFTKHARFLDSRFRFDFLPLDSAVMFGDILCICTNQNGTTNHAAIYMENGMLYHAVPCRGVGYSQYGSYWRKKTTKIMRVCGVE